MDRRMELAHLPLAERYIAAGELRVAAQAALIERMRAVGLPISAAEDLLALLQATLVEWRRHRSFIITALSDNENVRFPPIADLRM